MAMDNGGQFCNWYIVFCAKFSIVIVVGDFVFFSLTDLTWWFPGIESKSMDVSLILAKYLIIDVWYLSFLAILENRNGDVSDDLSGAEVRACRIWASPLLHSVCTQLESAMARRLFPWRYIRYEIHYKL